MLHCRNRRNGRGSQAIAPRQSKGHPGTGVPTKGYGLPAATGRREGQCPVGVPGALLADGAAASLTDPSHSSALRAAAMRRLRSAHSLRAVSLSSLHPPPAAVASLPLPYADVALPSVSRNDNRYLRHALSAATGRPYDGIRIATSLRSSQ